MSIEKLAEISRYYGANPEYTLAGGGNTSFKNDETLFVKASGFSLADACAGSFVKMDRKALGAIWEKTYSPSSEEREKEVLADLMASRCEGEGNKRPSVEALLHDIIPFAYVVHLHPALVNGLCCSQGAQASAKEIFASEALWIPSTNPGYVLSRLVKTALGEYSKMHNKNACVILLQNHGIFAGADSIEGIRSVYAGVMEKIGAKVKRRPDFSNEERNPQRITQQSNAHSEEILNYLKELAGFSAFMNSKEISSFLKDADSFYPVSSAYTPDHIVYAGSDPLFTEAKNAQTLSDEIKAHTKKTGRAPKIIAVKDTGIFSAAATEKAAGFALDLFKDTVKVAVYCQSFNGPLFMTRDKIDFINNWEVERFRSSVSTM